MLKPKEIASKMERELFFTGRGPLKLALRAPLVPLLFYIIPGKLSLQVMIVFF